MRLTGTANYFENFEVGDVYHHSRGRTIGEHDNHYFTLASLNTAQAHVNVEYSRGLFTGYPERLVNGGFTMALAVGLSAQDIAENAVAEVGMDDIRILSPLFHGDTIYSRSTIVDLQPAPDRADCGLVRYRVEAYKRDPDSGEETPVFSGEREILVKRGSEWADRDEKY